MNSPRPSGSNPEAFFQQETWDATRGPASRFRNSSTASISHHPWGKFIHSAPRGSGGSSSVQLYKITRLYDADYFGAKLWNPSTNLVSGSEITVAKCIGIRRIPSEVVDGIPINYMYPDLDQNGNPTHGNLRKASAAGFADEWHVCHTRYDAADIGGDVVVPPGLVFVMRSRNGTGVEGPDGRQLYLVEISPQRFWAWQQDQSGVI